MEQQQLLTASGVYRELSRDTNAEALAVHGAAGLLKQEVCEELV